MTSPNQTLSLKKSCVVMMIASASTYCSAFTLPTASSSTFGVKSYEHEPKRIRTELNSFAIDNEDEAMMMQKLMKETKDHAERLNDDKDEAMMMQRLKCLCDD